MPSTSIDSSVVHCPDKSNIVYLYLQLSPFFKDLRIFLKIKYKSYSMMILDKKSKICCRWDRKQSLLSCFRQRQRQYASGAAPFRPESCPIPARSLIRFLSDILSGLLPDICVVISDMIFQIAGEWSGLQLGRYIFRYSTVKLPCFSFVFVSYRLLSIMF